MADQFHGAWPALLTPSTQDGGVNVSALRDLSTHLLEKGIGGLYLCGSTGEGVFLSEPERRRVAEVVMDVVNDRVPVIVHVGTVATRHAVALAEHARDLGASGVASILPPFGRGLEEIYRHYEAIAAAVPDLPFYPYLFGGEADARSLMSGLLERIPTVAGAKYTGPNIHELQAIVGMRAIGWTIFSGMDEQCLFAAMVGSPANIGSTLNLMPGVYREIRSAYEIGEVLRARDLQLRVNRVTRVLQDYGFWGALFEALRLTGLNCGAPRLPRAALPLERRSALCEALAGTDFTELVAM